MIYRLYKREGVPLEKARCAFRKGKVYVLKTQGVPLQKARCAFSTNLAIVFQQKPVKRTYKNTQDGSTKVRGANLQKPVGRFYESSRNEPTKICKTALNLSVFESKECYIQISLFENMT